MDDQMLDLTDPGDRLTGCLLQVYGEDHLSPSIAATTRMRMGVMTAAHRRAALIEADATFDAAGETTTALAARRAHVARNAWRRPVAAVLAGCLTLGILAGTAFAARPGGPLYGARLWTEMANLPAGLLQRAQAEVGRLEQRLQEAQQASTAGDDAGTMAALVAYSKIVVEAAQGTDQNAAAKATIEATVIEHVALLTQMVQSVPAPARAAAEEALTSTTQALDDLTRAGNGAGTGAGTGAGSGAGPGTDSGGDHGAPGQANKPDKSAKPPRQSAGPNPDKANPGHQPTDGPTGPDRAP